MVARLLDGSFTALVRVSLNWMGWAGLGSGTKSCHGHKRGASGCRSRFGVVYLDVDMQIRRCNANSMCASVTVGAVLECVDVCSVELGVRMLGNLSESFSLEMSCLVVDEAKRRRGYSV